MTASDESWMRRALRLAARGAAHTSPNPMVGAVIVADGYVIGEGYHHAVGGPHAEVWALREAGDAARGATMYVTLEPCSHYGRTPPCTDAIIAARLGRVVAAVLDPDPRVNGAGVAKLRAAGIEVEVGVLEAEARALNAPYFKHKATGLPLVSLKLAMSLDGKIATRTGESKWITGERVRRFAHKLRAIHDAVMVGIGTVLADDPKLTVRISNLESRISNRRIVVDSLARTPPTAALLTADRRPPVIAVTDAAPHERVAALREAGAEVWVLAGEGQEASSCPTGRRVDLSGLMRRLGEQQVQSVLIEGGGTLASAALAAGLVDRVYFLIAPLIIGGAAAPTAVGGEGIARLADAWHITNMKMRRIGEDVLITGEVAR